MTLRFYSELAPWWPLISPPEEYAEEATFIASALRHAERPVHQVLELGSGGGHNAVHLKSEFELTLVDLSPEMLAMSRQLNPELEHHQGDMRTVRLGRDFDAVFSHDAVDYMTTEDDLRAAMATAYAHCRPGGLALFTPDDIRETFRGSDDHGGFDSVDGRGIRFLEWSWDPDPDDSVVRTEYAFVVREIDGTISSLHESHDLGCFSSEDWLRLLIETGFEAGTITEVTSENRAPRQFFVGGRPFNDDRG